MRLHRILALLPPALLAGVLAAAEEAPLVFVSDASYPPITFLDGGQPRGLAVDLVRELGRRMGRPIEIRLLDWTEAQEQVRRGAADAVFPLGVTGERRLKFDFSEPMLTLEYALFVPAADTVTKDLAGLAGRRVGVTASGLPGQLTRQDARVETVEIADYAQGFDLLQAGQIDAVAADRWVGSYLLAGRPGAEVRIAGRLLAQRPAAIAVRPGNTALLAAIDSGLRAMRDDGTLDRLAAEWRPQEVMYLTRGQVRQWWLGGTIALLATLLAAVAGWVVLLRRKIAGQRAADDRIAALNQRLAVATRAGGVGCWDWDVASDTLFWDDEMYRIFQVRREDFAGAFDAWSRTLHPDDRDRAQGEVRRALAGDEPFDTEFRIVWPDGQVRTIKASAQIFRDAAGRPVRMIGVNLDVTRFKVAEENLRLSESRLRALGDNLPDTMIYQVVREPDGTMRFLHVSAAVERLHGLKAADVLRDPALLYAMIAAEDQPALAAAEQASFATMTEMNLVVRMRRGDEMRWINIRSVPRRLADGRTLWDGIETDVTAQRRAEEAVRVSEEKYAKTFRSSPLAVVMSRVADGRILEMNTAAERLFGYSRAEVIGRTTAELGVWGDPAERERTMQELLVVGSVRDRELGLLNRAGEALITQYSAERVDVGGEPCVVSVLTDITRRKRSEDEVRQLLAAAEQGRAALLNLLEDQKLAEQSLRASEAQFRSVLTDSAIGMALVGLDRRWIEVNPALCRLLDCTREELLGRDNQEFLHPDDRGPAAENLRRLLAGEVESYNREKRYLRKDGRTVWVQLTVSLARDAVGRPRHLICQLQDISERKESARALAEAAERLQIALRVSRLGIWRRDLQTGLAQWDARMMEIFGLDPLGPVPNYEEFMNFVVPEDRPVVDAAWQRFSAGHEGYDLRFRIRRRDGQVRHVSAQGTMHRDETGRPVAVIGVDADLTEFTVAMEESGRLREKLRQAQKMETLGTLSAGIAHDFNNLLTGINGFVELGAASLPPDHEAVGLLRQARQGALSARDLVRRILAFARQMPAAERTVVPLAALLRETAPLVSAALPAHVTFAVQAQGEVPPVRVDAGQIQQVLLNLCVNGAHAIGSTAGQLRIEVRARVVAAGAAEPEKPGHYAVLSVTDTGCGMDAATCARIFEPFFTTKKAGEGTGLGLSVVQDIVADHGGFITVRSEPGRGTTFDVHLPAAAGAATAAPAPVVAAVIRGHGERILVVDDEPTVTSVVQRALTRAGYTPEVFNVAPEAWARFEADPVGYELLLLDFQMPGMTGGEFAGLVRRAGAALPIVIMTARTGDLDLEALQNLGGVGVLPKPFDIGELLERVAAVMPARAP